MIFEVNEVLDKFTKSEDVNGIAKRNRHPDSISYCYLKIDRNNRYITGYTPGYYNEADEAALMEERELLDKIANIRFDFNDIDDPFLSLLKIERALPENKKPILNTDEPLDLFKFRAAVANGYIAPRKEDVGIGRFSNTTYYFQSQEIVNKTKKDTSRLRLKAGSILDKNESTRAWLVIQCFLHGMNVKPSYKDDTLFAYLAKIVEDAKTVTDLEEVIRQFSRPNQEIESIFVAKKSVDIEIVKFDSISREYVFTSDKIEGVTSLGETVKDVEQYLRNTKKGQVFSEIRKAVYSKFEI